MPDPERPARASLGVPNSRGNATDKRHFMRSHWNPLLKRADLSPIRFHDLRHTTATLLLERGVHTAVVQRILGHASIAITLDTYSSVAPAVQEGALAQLDAVIGN